MDQTQRSRFLSGAFFALLFFALLAVLYTRTSVSIRISKKAAEEPLGKIINKATLHAEIRAYILENPGIIFEAAAIARAREAEQESKRDSDLINENWNELQDDGRSYVGGNLEGDITLIEFLDYRCGYCRKAYEDVEALLAEDGNIRFIIKEYPILGDASTTMAQFAIAAKNLHGPDVYKLIHDTLMSFSGDPAPEALAEIAIAFGLEPTPIIEEMMSEAVMEEIGLNRALADKMKISGTPTFILGAALLRGYLPLDALREVIKEARDP